MAHEYDVLVLGDYCLDLIFTRLSGFPELGREVVGREFARVPGGAFNAAAAMHRLGLKVGWAADFGDDDFSRFALDQARAEGLDESLFVHHPRAYRSVTVALSYPEDRAFIAYYDPPVPIPAAMKALARCSARVVYLAGFYAGPLLEAGIAMLHLRNMRLVMDGNTNASFHWSDASVQRVLGHTDVFMPSAREARALTGQPDSQAALDMLAQVCPLVVMKDGANGAHAARGDEVIHAPAIAVAPVETTGAGDAFNAGFLRAWLDGRSLPECLRWGNIAGGLSTLGMGGTGRRVTLEEIQQRAGQPSADAPLG